MKLDLKDCTITIYWSDPDGFWIAQVEEIHNCAGNGYTPEVAFKNVVKVFEAMQKLAEEKGNKSSSPVEWASTRSYWKQAKHHNKQQQ